MNILLSSLSVCALAAVHIFIGRMHWLSRDGHSSWLSVSAGTALSYVFVYLLPKLNSAQEEIFGTAPADSVPTFIRNEIYLIALAGLVCFFWLGWQHERTCHESVGGATRTRSLRWLHIGGYGFYSFQVGILIAGIPQPDPPSYLLATIVLGLHLMGVDHGIRNSDPVGYERLLRWVLSAALLLGWAIGLTTTKFDVIETLGKAFIGGGIMITALREELPGRQMSRFLPFFFGVLGSTLAILTILAIQNSQ